SPTPVDRGPLPAAATIAPGVALATFDSMWTVVARTYVDTAFVSTRWGAVRDSLRPRAALVTTREGLSRLMAATLAEIHDSHFYIIPANVAADVRSDDDNSESGEGTTGASVRIAGDRALVWRVEPGSPAALAGLKPGQTVKQIQDRVARSSIARVLALPDASRQRALAELDFRLNGALSPSVGDTVRVRFVQGGKETERTLVAVPVRGTVSKFGNLPPLAGRVSVTRIPVAMTGTRGNDSCVGMIAFNIWLPMLAPELQRAVDSVADCAGIVLDVRGNPGGIGAMVMGFGGYFVDSATSLGTMKTREVTLNFVINPRRVRVKGVEGGPFKGPVAIIVDPMSASTSEIFATGMQRIGRARVFGERSAGAALPALMQALPSGDVFVHAVADFTDPTGRRIEGAGVSPDELVPLTEADLSRNIDAPFEAAIRWIKGGGK
ncbi:MAG: S41 family peptidase, partial [Gemmatimonadales bacterium]